MDVKLGLKWVQVVCRFESWKDKRNFHLKFVAFFSKAADEVIC